MTPCTPIAPFAHAVAPMLRTRPHRAVHYAVSHKAKAAAGHHAVSGHPVAHLPVARHARPVNHHVAAPPADTGACGVSDATHKLHAGQPGLGHGLGGKAGAAQLGGLAAGGAAVGIGAVAAMAGGDAQGFGGGHGQPGYGAPGFGLGGAPGGGHPRVNLPGGQTGDGGGAPVVVVSPPAITPQPPVSVPEPATAVILAVALLALALARWRPARR